MFSNDVSFYIFIVEDDFIDKDVVEVIEDFAIHAPLKNIKVEVKRSQHKEQGFSDTIINDKNEKDDIVRKSDSVLETIEP